MGEPKPLATLSSSLLARKGQAKPAMRPQGYGSFGFNHHTTHDDLGWNDMGVDPQPVELQPAAPQPISAAVVPIIPDAPPPVVRQQEELARELEPVVVADYRPEPDPEPVVVIREAAAQPRAAAGSKAKAAFTLRLDSDRHLRLRLSCAVLHKSAQAIVVAALDAFLDSQPGVAELARTATERKARP